MITVALDWVLSVAAKSSSPAKDFRIITGQGRNSGEEGQISSKIRKLAMQRIESSYDWQVDGINANVGVLVVKRRAAP